MCIRDRSGSTSGTSRSDSSGRSGSASGSGSSDRSGSASGSNLSLIHISILKSITRQLATISGTVYLDKEKMAKMTNKEVSQKLAVVLTEPGKYNLLIISLYIVGRNL